MLNILKFKGDESDFLFSADAHINQSCDSWEVPLWRARGFSSVADHRIGYVNSWNLVSGDEKICFHIGDMVFQDQDGKEFRKIINELNYKELYIFQGNHVSGHKPVYLEALKHQFPEIANLGLEVYPLTLHVKENKKVVFLPEYADIKINGTFIACCHYPIISHSMMNKKSIHICGHSHNNCEITSREKGTGLRIDVGFDGWKRPISLKEIKDHLKDREINAVDHHVEGM